MILYSVIIQSGSMIVLNLIYFILENTKTILRQAHGSQKQMIIRHYAVESMMRMDLNKVRGLKCIKRIRKIQFVLIQVSISDRMWKISEWFTNRLMGYLRARSGGHYNLQGNKQGEWIEPHLKDTDVSFKGFYQNGMHVGEWKVLIDGNEYQIQGEYDINGVKQGQWIEVDSLSQWKFLITNVGQYKNGIPIGKWQTQLENQNIGGGEFDEENIMKVQQVWKKIGKWVDFLNGEQKRQMTFKMVLLYENEI